MKEMAGSSGVKRFFRDIAKECYKCEDDFIVCNIDSNRVCNYKHLKSNYDAGNFIRHLRSEHSEMARKRGLLKEDCVSDKKRKIPKTFVALDRQAVIGSVIKLISYHNMPFSAVEWEGFRELLDPICDTLKIKINGDNTTRHIKQCATKIKEKITAEMKGRLICVKIDSASRFGRHVLGVNAQFTDGYSVILRTLAMMEVENQQTVKDIKSKLDEVLGLYGISQEQVLSVTCDSGANMIGATCEMQNELANFVDEEAGTDDFLSDSIMVEFEKEISLVRCAAHTMQLAMHDVVKKRDLVICEISKVAVACHQAIYKDSFEIHSIALPPFYTRSRWEGIYTMLAHFKEHEDFYKEMGSSYKDLDLDLHWEFIKKYVQAFEPVYTCTKEMQSHHVSLSGFYIQWLKAVMEVSNIQSNELATELGKALMNRLDNLKTNTTFKACLLLDPRLNYLNSKILSLEEKQETRHFLAATKDRFSEIQRVKAEPESKSTTKTTKSDEFDTFLTNMLGGGLPDRKNNEITFYQELCALDLEAHQSYSFDVWKHWVDRKSSHKDLANVALCILSAPSTQVSVERAFSALELVLAEHRANLSDILLENILLVKLNKDLLYCVLPQLYNWQEDVTL